MRPPFAVADAAALIQLINSVWMSQAVCAAADLRISDILATGAKQIDHLARATCSDAASLRRLMHALVSLDLCEEREDGSFDPTGYLLSDRSPHSLRAWALWSGRHLWPLWGNLLGAVKSGRHARHLTQRTDGFEHLGDESGVASLFNEAMANLAQLIATGVAQAYSFVGKKLIVDVGGGFGALLAAALQANPDARGILYDLPHAIDGARSLVRGFAAPSDSRAR